MRQTAILEDLIEIWSEVLGLPRDSIGVDVDFLQYGDSLAALIMCSRVEERFGFEMPLVVLPEHPTLNAIVAWVGERMAGASGSLT